MLTALLFGVRLQGSERIHWDMTTLVLQRALRLRLRSGMRVAEIGTGPYALLARIARRLCTCTVDAGDINPTYVQSASQEVAGTASSVSVIESDLFAAFTGQYDLVFSNTLYIPRADGRSREIDRMHPSETDWCGGESGYEFIERLLADARPRLRPQGLLLLGFNAAYLDEQEVRRRCDVFGYEVDMCTRMPLNPSCVLHLTAQQSQQGQNPR
ncbi:methyltransferase [bacterium]|nr:methyltransferase [bacterium]